ncbi:type IV secretion system T-DNA border endonuclease VirD2 [Agrobacterium larrymoorei]|uniref:Type IV secretion system T-DNA border endonuclease VirD2 n=1 Tax=Agrobacterium larrymoorei TaxID=160699 RepID=A0AAJ2ER96_9HYPH|nr:relaxase/mobilization nuclease domain-containing protein [Agrobacterium larrymoorei]MDR6101876.1 type IV secretion system T-DNA border endonuclease VirD2 [Agrobacterium larrymoorei]
MPETPQAIVHIIRGGGCQTIGRICSQWEYLSRKGELEVRFSERHGGGVMLHEEFEIWAKRWAEQTGHYIDGVKLSDGHPELTTHIVVSFPPGTDEGAAEDAGRLWAENMFGSGENGGEWDYVTVFHTDRPHPHLHVVVNRRALSNRAEWLAIAHRNDFLNYDSLREGLADAAYDCGIALDASSREERGLEGHNPTRAQYRQWARIGFRNHTDEDDEEVNLSPDGNVEVFPELTGIDPGTGSSANGIILSAEAEASRRHRIQESRRRAEAEVHEQEGLPHRTPAGARVPSSTGNEWRDVRVDDQFQQEPEPMELDHPADRAEILAAGEPMDVDSDAAMEVATENLPINDGSSAEAERQFLEEHQEYLARAVRARAQPSRRRPEVRSIIETRGQKIRRMAEEKRARRARRNQNQVDRIIETRAQKQARLEAEAEARRAGAASIHPMTLRSAGSREGQSETAVVDQRVNSAVPPTSQQNSDRGRSGAAALRHGNKQSARDGITRKSGRNGSGRSR